MEKISAYIISNENAIPYIEFEIVHKKQKINGTEHLYIKDKLNKSNNRKLKKKFSIGTLLIHIINLYDKIMSTLKECREIIYESEKICDGDYRDSVQILKKRLLDISEILNILTNYIDCFYIDIYINYYKELTNIQNELYTAEHFWNNLENPQHKQYYNELKNKYEYMRTAQYMKDKCLEFFDNLIAEFKEMKNIVDNSFVYSKEDSRTKIFSGISLVLPTPIINFSNEFTKCPTPIKYTYTLKCLTEFFNCSIYHIYLSGKVIAKCKGCGKYFIPSRTNQVYCNEKCRELKEEKIGNKRGEKYSNNSYKLYECIRKRLNHSPKKYEKEIINFKENYKYNDLLEKLERLYIKDNTINIELELLKIYTKIDKYLQQTYPSRNKCKTSKYWVE